MKVEIKSVRDVGSCNFCRRGKMLNSPIQLPYDYIYEIDGNSVSVNMCEDCMIEFTEKMLALPVISEMGVGV